MPLKLVNWNVEKATPRSKKTPEILGRIGQHAPEILCLTEAHTGLWTEEGDTICAQPYNGRDIRKVVLWSREPWEQVDCVGSSSLLPGRFVSGVTKTSIGEVTFIGVCIPYKFSRTKECKKLWEDHKQYLADLSHVLEQAPAKRLIVVGDFNQRIGQVRYPPPPDVRAALKSAMPPHMTIATSELCFQGEKLIDHIAISDDLAVESLCVISRWDGDTELSDRFHHGTVAEVSTKDPS